MSNSQVRPDVDAPEPIAPNNDLTSIATANWNAAIDACCLCTQSNPSLTKALQKLKRPQP